MRSVRVPSGSGLFGLVARGVILCDLRHQHYAHVYLRALDDSRDVQTKCVILYFLFWKSAMTQSTICGCGVRKYKASTSRLVGLRSVICSMSGVSKLGVNYRLCWGGGSWRGGSILVMFSFSKASSSMTLSSSRLLSRSTTRTFHCDGYSIRQLRRMEEGGGVHTSCLVMWWICPNITAKVFSTCRGTC